MKEKKTHLLKSFFNCFYILRYAYNKAPLFYSFYTILLSTLAALDGVLSVLFVKKIIDYVTMEYEWWFLFLKISLWGIAIVLTSAMLVVLQRLHEIKNNDIAAEIQKDIMLKARRLDIICYDDTQFYNEFIKSSEKGKEQIIACINVVARVISQTISIFSILGVVIYMDFIAALIPIMAFIVNGITLSIINRIRYSLWNQLDVINRKKYYSRKIFYQSEYAKDVKLTHIGDALITQFDDAIEEEREAVKRIRWKITLFSMLNYIMSWTIFVYYLPPFYFIYTSLITKKHSVSELSALYNSNTNVTYTLDNMLWRFIELDQIGLYGKHFKKFMEYSENIETRVGKNVDGESVEEIRFENVSFSYDGEKNVLKNVNISIKKGEKIAIVGYNGAGKSTLLKLLLNLYQPSSGRILINEVNINELSIHSFRNLFSTVSQNFQIFAGSILENVTFDTGHFDKERFENAITNARIAEKIKMLPNREQTILTKEFDIEGINMSGGESQRLALARAFYKNAPFFILDEPTSALDPIVEYELNESVLASLEDKTAIFISHRLGTIKHCDCIYMFENGTIIEKGSHNELIEKKGKYAEMFYKQSLNYVLQNSKNHC